MIYESLYFETDEPLINSARKNISIQFLYSFLIAVKWFIDYVSKLLGGFTSTYPASRVSFDLPRKIARRVTSTAIEMQFILTFSSHRCFRFPSPVNAKKDPSPTKSGKLKRK